MTRSGSLWKKNHTLGANSMPDLALPPKLGLTQPFRAWRTGRRFERGGA